MLVFGGSAFARHPLHREPRHAETIGRAIVTAQAGPAAPPSNPQGALPAAQDLSHAVSLRDAAKLPRTEDQIRALKSEIAAKRPAAETAKRKSELLNAEADDLRRRLDESTARVQALEDEKGHIDAELARLIPEEHRMTDAFARERTQITGLLAVLERLQSDMPPVIAVRASDALSAARGAMELGNSLPRIYQAAAELSRQLHGLQAKREELLARERESVRVSGQLSDARDELDQLLAIKSQEADAASAQYGDLESRLEAEAGRAASLESLVAKVAELRTLQKGQGIVVVPALNASRYRGIQHGAIVWPVTGPVVPGGPDGVGGARAPGVTILAPSGADVVSPGDGQVLFAGPYHKTGKVLILELGGGYDLLLAGLDRLDVRSGDELLAGEPVGAMPRAGAGTRLYFELRQNGKGVNPTPWMEVDLRKAKRS